MVKQNKEGILLKIIPIVYIIGIVLTVVFTKFVEIDNYKVSLVVGVVTEIIVSFSIPLFVYLVGLETNKSSVGIIGIIAMVCYIFFEIVALSSLKKSLFDMDVDMITNLSKCMLCLESAITCLEYIVILQVLDQYGDNSILGKIGAIISCIAYSITSMIAIFKGYSSYSLLGETSDWYLIPTYTKYVFLAFVLFYVNNQIHFYNLKKVEESIPKEKKEPMESPQHPLQQTTYQQPKTNSFYQQKPVLGQNTGNTVQSVQKQAPEPDPNQAPSSLDSMQQFLNRNAATTPAAPEPQLEPQAPSSLDSMQQMMSQSVPLSGQQQSPEMTPPIINNNQP